AHLKEKRYIAPLFDAERFCDHLEKAYEVMAERARQGLAPDHMDIPALPPRTAPFVAEWGFSTAATSRVLPTGKGRC
ncbi:hypothetical protein, partial [Rhizobium johnstonii]|uniref:hypothetical protein n=1 Tax=Rhizobium johnstonii TaxID=3019933 RepID=UPI003F9B1AB6